jgi:hypothetical protein
MNISFRRLVLGLVAAAIVLGAASLLAPPTSAKGPKPPSCPNCPSTIVVGGRVCTLSACGSDCVYTCPF